MIGIASPAFCFRPFDEVLEDVSKNFRLWEVLVEGEHRLEVARSSMVRAMDSFDMQLQIHAPMSDVNIGSIHEPMRKSATREIASTIEACSEMGVSLVTIHPGFIGGIAFLDKSMVLTQTKRSLTELAPIAADNSVELVLENMPRGINATCTTAAELIELTSSTGLGVCFDMGHANTAGQVDEFLRHSSMFRNVHLHNNDGSWDQHNPIDVGTADVGSVVRDIQQGGYRGNYVIESTDLDGGIVSRDVLACLLEPPPAPDAL